MTDAPAPGWNSPTATAGLKAPARSSADKLYAPELTACKFCCVHACYQESTALTLLCPTAGASSKLDVCSMTAYPQDPLLQPNTLAFAKVRLLKALYKGVLATTRRVVQLGSRLQLDGRLHCINHVAANESTAGVWSLPASGYLLCLVRVLSGVLDRGFWPTHPQSLLLLSANSASHKSYERCLTQRRTGRLRSTNLPAACGP